MDRAEEILFSGIGVALLYCTSLFGKMLFHIGLPLK